MDATMEALGADLREMILRRKMDADEVSLTFYTEDGEVAFFVARNLNDAPWRVRFASADEDTFRHARLAAAAYEAAADDVAAGGADQAAGAPARGVAARDATWTPLVLTRNERALEELVANAVGRFHDKDEWIYLYRQGPGAAVPPPYECLSYERRAAPARRDATPERAAALHAFRRGCVHGSANAWAWRKGTDSLLGAVLQSIRALVAEA